MPFIYDGCTGIYFPIHTSKKFARMVGLPDIILQGTATLALAVSEIIAREASGDPEKVSVIACKFTDMVIPGGAISIEAERRDGTNGQRHVSFRVINGAGRRAISEGYVKII
jgi:acyl dehydratase